jgi:hypothetical protein
MKDAIVAAAEELGQVDRNMWEEAIRLGDLTNGMKRFFKVMAVEEPRASLFCLQSMASNCR